MIAAGKGWGILLLALDMSVFLPGLYLVGALLIGAAVIALFNRWRRQSSRDEASSTSEQLAHFRSLYEQGVLSQEEFNRLRTRLGGQLRESLELPARPSAGSGAKQVKSPQPPQLPAPAPDVSHSEEDAGREQGPTDTGTCLDG